uniref:Uncharacterized protein n=1 Tax=Candidatus Kentrum eta TaxID=2126337 RepID=A0A450UP34_9GAMM|nr:MAG: hypothetical protein BECKH772A_GA0070896_100702 [Candidatus Kentron sp. H]VFJ95202.1 MAG: hypothetical protein BECKH772B_GA0070898_100732 [Candidatus Kentron sp. H]VFK01400.1 MAG: hypothetical protein BECKH772C_GA0070978_100652 [Candidatus Kentron sp. H]
MNYPMEDMRRAALQGLAQSCKDEIDRQLLSENLSGFGPGLDPRQPPDAPPHGPAAGVRVMAPAREVAASVVEAMASDGAAMDSVMEAMAAVRGAGDFVVEAMGWDGDRPGEISGFRGPVAMATARGAAAGGATAVDPGRCPKAWRRRPPGG